MLSNKLLSAIIFLGVVLLIWSCKAKNDYPGLEYAPNMYHAVPYEPLKQITDTTEGMWLSNRADGKGEYFNSNVHNPHNMNMRRPVPGTVRRSDEGVLPYTIPKDSIHLADALVNPLDSTAEVLSEGQTLYTRFCSHCHGATGQGDGKVGMVFKGIPAYNTGRVKEVSAGHIFHVITRGYGRMGAHASQIDVLDRWKIVRYVQTLQNQ